MTGRAALAALAAAGMAAAQRKGAYSDCTAPLPTPARIGRPCRSGGSPRAG